MTLVEWFCDVGRRELYNDAFLAFRGVIGILQPKQRIVAPLSSILKNSWYDFLNERGRFEVEANERSVNDRLGN